MARSPFTKKQLLPIPEEASPEPFQVFRDVYERGARGLQHAPRHARRSSLSRKLAMAFFSMVLLLGTITAMGFYFFVYNPDIKFGEEMVDLTLTTPTSLASGAPLTTVVHYENRGALALHNAVLELTPPVGFVPDEPHTGVSWSFSLGTLVPYAKGETSLTGIMLRQEGSVGTWRAMLVFTPAGFGAEFRKSRFVTATVTSPAFITSVNTPQHAMPGKPYSFNVRIRNTTRHILPNMGVMIALPQGVPLATSDPTLVEASPGYFLWRIDTIPDGASWEGTATLDIPSSFVLPASMKVTVGTTSGNELITLEEHTVVLGSSIPQGNIDIRIHGSTTQGTMAFVDPLDVVVTITNPLDHDMKHITLQMEVNERPGNILDWSKIKSDVPVEPVSASQTDGAITHFVVSASRFAPFTLVKAGAKVAFAFTVPRSTSASPLDVPQGTVPSLSSTATITYLDGTEEATMVSSPVTISLNSNLALSLTARYFDDNHVPLGEGPVPFKVGETTRVRIPVHITNSLHELTSLTLDLSLGSPSVRVVSMNMEAGDMHEDAERRSVVWSLNRFPPSVSKIQGFIDVSVTPSSQEADKVLHILESATLSAQDAATLGSIKIQQGLITSRLEDDPFAKGKGIVVR